MPKPERHVLVCLNTRPPGDTALYGNYFGEYNNTYGGTGGSRVLQLAVKLYF